MSVKAHDLLRKIESHCGKVQVSDLGSLVFTAFVGGLRKEYTTLSVTQDSGAGTVDGTEDPSIYSVTFCNAADVTAEVTLELGNIVDVRWVAAGAAQEGTVEAGTV